MSRPPEQSFATTYDLSSKIITTLVIAFLLAAAVLTRSSVAGTIGVCVVGLCYAFSPRSYTVSGPAILIHRGLGTVRIPLEGIRELRATTPADLRWSLRLCGSGGFFGYYGWFRTASLGTCRWYRTNRGPAVLLVTERGTTLLSPDDIGGFLTAVQSVAPLPETTGIPLAFATGTTQAKPTAQNWLGGAIVAVVACVLCFAFLYSPGPPRLTLTPTTLTIHDRFYPTTVQAVDVDVPNIRIVDLHTDHAWQPTFKVNGFANAHYHSGWFRVASGSARMYWATGPRLVLLPPRTTGAPVLLQVPDPDRFVATLHQQWPTH